MTYQPKEGVDAKTRDEEKGAQFIDSYESDNLGPVRDEYQLKNN